MRVLELVVDERLGSGRREVAERAGICRTTASMTASAAGSPPERT
jgi:hypothetical protein